jgi:beta-N-acetylhexosaminidase
MLKKVLFLVLLSALFVPSLAQDLRSRWVDSVFSTLSREAKIGQLFMVPISTYASAAEKERIASQVKNQFVGAYYVTGGGPLSHSQLFNRLQKSSRVPLMAAISAEWGLGQTLDSTMTFQKPLITGSWKYDSLSVKWSRQIAMQLKLLGFHINFAPNLDFQPYSDDYLRYFGNEKPRASFRLLQHIKTQQRAGILCVAMHAPIGTAGEIPVSDRVFLQRRLDSDTARSAVLKEAIDGGVKGLLAQDLNFSVQTINGIAPAGETPSFISETLRKKLGFNGLVFADVKKFENAAAKIKKGDPALLAFESGADVLIAQGSLNAAIRKIGKKVKNTRVLDQQLTATVKKILGAKYDAGLNRRRLVDTDNLLLRLHTPDFYLAKHELSEAAVTVARNEESLLPIRSLERRDLVALSIGNEADNPFTHMLRKYAEFKTLSIKDVRDTANISFDPASTLVVAVFPNASKIEKHLLQFVNRLTRSNISVLVHFGNPMMLDYYEAKSIVAAYTDQDYMTSVVPQTIFGALPATGILAVTLESATPPIETTSIDRFAYTLPEAAGLDSKTLEKTKAVMKEAIDIGATPGCHVLVARKGKVIYEQSAGSLTYENKAPVTDETIYDLASVTKISATLQAVMFMYERGLIDLNKKASVYLPELKESNKKDLLLKDILTHQAGLWPFLPFWTQTMKDSTLLPEFYSSVKSPDYPYPVADSLYAIKAMKDSLWQWIIKAKVREKPLRTPYDYRYSDMGFYILQHLAEKMLNQPMDEFLQQNLYEPLGAYTTGYLPLRKFPIGRIAPTENDKLFRKRLLTGYVHDQGAAMHGGIAGHAGLFSTANDLAKLGQMWLQKGHYGGKQYFKPETIELFASKQFEDSRRGLGWDKPPQSDWNGPVTLFASPKTFGHTGFTGTCIWVDPEFDLVFVFVSNRVYPEMTNNKLLTANIRSRVQEIVYRAMFDFCGNKN